MSELRISKPLLADTKLSLAAKLLLAALLDHRNKTTGQCNPRQFKLAEELGISEDKVQRGVVELRLAGLVQMKKGQRGSKYEISIPQICGIHSAKVRNGGSRSLYEPTLLKESPPPKKSVQSEARSSAAIALARYYAQQQRKTGGNR